MSTSVKLDDNLKSRIQRLAEARNRTAHWIMREAIRDYVGREEAKESFRQEAMNAWEAYCETGKHLTGREVQDWLSSWDSGDKTRVPPCHD